MSKKIVVLVKQEGLGTVGEEARQFSVDMFDRFLHSLESQALKPATICFFTDGVKLVCEGSAVVPSLRLIQGMGVKLLVCRTCLERFGLLDRVAAGDVSTMNDIVRTMLDADQVLTV